MVKIWFILTFCVLIITAEDEDDDSKIIEDLCGKLSKELVDDLDKCSELDPEILTKTVEECQKKVIPDVGTDTYSFLSAACKEPTIFDKMDDCMRENKETLKDVELNEEGNACIKEFLKKYDLEK